MRSLKSMPSDAAGNPIAVRLRVQDNVQRGDFVLELHRGMERESRLPCGHLIERGQSMNVFTEPSIEAVIGWDWLMDFRSPLAETLRDWRFLGIKSAIRKSGPKVSEDVADRGYWVKVFRNSSSQPDANFDPYHPSLIG